MADTMHAAAQEAHDAGYGITECKTCSGWTWIHRSEYLGEKQHTCGYCEVKALRAAEGAK